MTRGKHRSPRGRAGLRQENERLRREVAALRAELGVERRRVDHLLASHGEVVARLGSLAAQVEWLRNDITNARAQTGVLRQELSLLTRWAPHAAAPAPPEPAPAASPVTVVLGAEFASFLGRSAAATSPDPQTLPPPVAPAGTTTSLHLPLVAVDPLPPDTAMVETDMGPEADPPFGGPGGVVRPLRLA